MVVQELESIKTLFNIPSWNNGKKLNCKQELIKKEFGNMKFQG